jgi:hypothetical protein
MYSSNREVITMEITLIIGFFYLRAGKQEIAYYRQAL